MEQIQLVQLKTDAAKELAKEWRRFREEFDRFYDILTDAIES